jgi:hypothetical protein
MAGVEQLQQTICEKTCPECPLRNAYPQTQDKALKMLNALEAGEATVAIVGRFAEDDPDFSFRGVSNNLMKCARNIVFDACERYDSVPNPGNVRLNLDCYPVDSDDDRILAAEIRDELRELGAL